MFLQSQYVTTVTFEYILLIILLSMHLNEGLLLVVEYIFILLYWYS